MDKTQACVCVVAALVYFNALDAGFVYDDRRAILTNPDVTSSPLQNLLYSDFWGTPLYSSNSHGSYRPLCVLTFRINYWISGLHPLGYHLVNIILHSITTGLVLEVGRIVLPRRCPAVAALLFAVQPVHTEAVAGIVGRADILACIFYLLSFIMFAKHVKMRERFVSCKQIDNDYTITAFKRHAHFSVKGSVCSERFRFIKVHVLLFLTVCFITCATLCKETGLTTVGVCAVYDLLVQLRSKRKFKHYDNIRKSSLIVLTTTSCVLLFLRVYLMGAKLPVFAKSDNPIVFIPSTLARMLTFLYLPVENFKLFVYPRWLSFDWSMEAVSPITHFSDYRNLLSLVFYYVIYRAVQIYSLNCSRPLEQHKVCFKRKCNICRDENQNVRPLTCYTTNNMTNSSHLTYISTCECVLLCMSFLVIPFLPASNLPFYVGFVIAERILYLPSIGYCFLFSMGWKILSTKVNKRLSLVFIFVLLLSSTVRTLQRNKDWLDEESLYRSGIPINPAKAYGNLGSVLSTKGRTHEAEAALRMALMHRPNMADVHYNLGNLQRGLKRFKEAINSYKMAIQFRPSLAVAYLNLGHLLASLGNFEEAEVLLWKCSRLDSTGLKDVRAHQDTKTNALLHLGRLYFERGKFQKAVEVLQNAIIMKSKHYSSQMLYSLLAEALRKTDRNEEADVWYKAALSNSHLPIYLKSGKYMLNNRNTTLES